MNLKEPEHKVKEVKILLLSSLLTAFVCQPQIPRRTPYKLRFSQPEEPPPEVYQARKATFQLPTTARPLLPY